MHRQSPARHTQRLALVVALSAYLLFTLGLLKTTRNVLPSDMRVGYPLDDTYIHMAIARHVVEDGVWGITPYQFSSTSSSPLWTATLATAYAVVGVNAWLPLALNMIFGTLTVWVAYILLKRHMSSFWLGITLTGLVFFVPLSSLSATGMEHTLHTGLTLATLYLAAELLAADKIPARRLALLLALTALTVSARYEGLFLLFVMVALFGISAVRKRSRERLWAAAAIGLAGMSLVSLYGMFSVAHGWPPLPPSVFLKGEIPGQLSWLERLVPMVRFIDLPEAHLLPPLITLFIACIALYAWEVLTKRASSRIHYVMLLFVFTTFLHTEFARIGAFFRYEGYLIGVGTVIFGELLARAWTHLTQKDISRLKRRRKEQIVLAFLGTMVTLMFIIRTLNIVDLYWRATRNIYQQQVQMGHFVRAFYNERTIAANDIGAINYLADVRLLDLYGLGTLPVAYARYKGTLDRATIAELVEAEGTDMIVIYRSWFEGDIPESWVSVGSWQIQNNVVCGDDIVEFFAPSTEKAAELITHLQEFSDRLPPDVVQSGLYTER